MLPFWHTAVCLGCMSNKRLFTVLFSAISIGSSKFILASLATDANSGPDKEGVDIKAAAKKNEENIFKKLTEEQLAKLPELKNKLSSHQLNRWPAAGEDMALYRFLKARDFDIDASFTMLDEHLKWRAKTYPIKKSTWVNDPFFKAGACIPHGGLDAEGRPLLILKSGRFPVAKRNMENCLDGIVAIMTEHANTYGLHGRFTVLYDRQDFDRSTNFDTDLLKAVAGVLSANNPEALERACLYPCGFMLRGIWQIVKWFFDPVTRKKILMLGYPENFFDYVPKEQLPPDMGGTSRLVWPENSEQMWKERIMDFFPDETIDNWQSSEWKPTAGDPTVYVPEEEMESK